MEEAIRSVAGGDAKFIAGGHSLIPAMKLKLSRPSRLVDITGIDSLKGISEDKGEIVIGAATTHNSISKNELIRKALPFFSEGASMIGDLQVRNHGTIGGSIAHADPAADWPALLLAADARIVVQNVNGQREIKVSDFFVGLFETSLLPDEIIVAIRIPVPPKGTKTAYRKFFQPASRFAMVGCAVLRQANGKTNVAFTGVADHAFRDKEAEECISGKAINDKSIADTLKVAIQQVNIMSDHYASQEYRKHLAKVFLGRTLQAVS